MSHKTRARMKRGIVATFLTIIMISPLMFLWLSHAEWQPGASAIDNLIYIGKSQIAQKSTIGVQSAFGTFQQAYDTKYTQASDLQKIKIAMYLSLTRLLDFVVRKDGVGTETLPTFLAKYGVTYTGTDKDDLNLITPVDNPKNLNTLILPANAPSGEAIRGFLAGPVINTLNASISDMDKVIGLLGANESKEIISKTLINPDDPSQLDVEIDDGDYYLFRSWLKAAKALALTMSVYDMNVSVTELVGLINSGYFNFKELLDRHPQLLTILTTGGSPSYDGAGKLAEARTNLVSAIADYMIASEKIRNDQNTTPGAEELFALVTQADLADEQKFRNYLTELQYSLTNSSHPASVFDPGDSDPLTLNLNPLFGNGSGPVSLRSMLPQFTEFAWGYPVSSTMGHGLGNDPTLGGIFPTFAQNDWNQLDKNGLNPTGTVIIPTKTITVDGLTPDWEGIAPFMEPSNRVDGTYDAGRDIARIFMAKDATNYYFRMDTAGARGNPAQVYDYTMEFKQNPGNSSYRPGDKRVVARYYQEDVWTITTTGGTVMEFHMRGKNDWGSYAAGGLFYVKTVGTDTPALPSVGQASSWAGSLSNGNLNIYINSGNTRLQVWGPVSGSALTSGTVQYYDGSQYYNYSTSSGSYVTTSVWTTYLAVCNLTNGYISWVAQNLGENMSMGVNTTVEWKAPLALIGDVSGYLIAARAKSSVMDYYSWWGESSYTTQQIGPLEAMGKVTGNLTIPGYDGTGNIYIGVYSTATGYKVGEALAFKTIYPGGYSAGMAFSFDKLPVGANLVMAIHWDRDGNGMISAGDYSSFSASFTTSSTVAAPQIPTPKVNTPYPAPVLEFAEVSKITGSANGPYWLRAVVLGPSPENVTVTVKDPYGLSYPLIPLFFQKQRYGQLYAFSTANALPSGEYTFEAVDLQGRKAAPVKKMFIPYEGVPTVDTATLRVNNNAAAANNGAFYTNADPSTTPIALSWGGVGSGYLYDVEVYDLYGRVVFFMTAPSSLSVPATSIPAGTLQPETPYLFYVKTSDPNHPGNSTLTEAKTIYTGSQSTPAFSVANISFINTPYVHPQLPITAYPTNAVFKMPGVLPSEIAAFTIKNGAGEVLQTFNAAPGTAYRFDKSAHYSYGWLMQNLPPDGNYTFEATINRGGAQTVITSNPFAFTYSNVPTVDYQTLSPGDNVYFDTTMPTFTWTGVAGTYYRLQIFDTNISNTEVYSSAWDTGKTSYSAAVPAGKLIRGARYYWTVQSSNTNTDIPNVVNYAVGAKKYYYKDMNRFTILPDADLKAAVSGQIRNENNQIQAGALVEALLDGVVVGSTTTNILGQYALNLAKNQTYAIRVTVPGYAPKTLNVSVAGGDLSDRNIAFVAGDIDNTAPTISNLLPTEGEIGATRPEISAIIQNSGVSGIDPLSINLYVDWERVEHTYNPATGKVSFTPSSPFSSDVHTVVLDVKNYAGKSAWASWYFVVVSDTTPDPFVFNDKTGVALNTVIASNVITVSGITVASPISITGGTYSINGGAYTSASGFVSNGDTVTVRQTSSAAYSTTTNATLTVGGVSDTFSVTTQASSAQAALYAAFTGAGIWKYSGTGTDWEQVTASNPQLLVTVGSNLYGTFPGLGIWKFNGTDWDQTTTSVPEMIVGTSSTLYGSFEGLGIWQWNGTQWTQTTTSIPQTIIASTSDLYGTFTGLGIWKWDGANWSNLTMSIPDKLVTSGIKLYGAFSGQGIWLWNGTEWKQATSSNPQLIAASSSKLYGSFAGAGIWEWDGAATWTQISPDTPTQMVASGAELYAVFAGVGIKKWDGTTWSMISGNEPAGMVVGE